MRKRIALEYADHLALRPRRGGAAGNPEELAGKLAAELAADDARRVARNTFAALAVPTIMTILIAPQIALVAGSLAALRALRRRQSRRLPAGEGRDIQPRVLLSGMRVLAG